MVKRGKTTQSFQKDPIEQEKDPIEQEIDIIFVKINSLVLSKNEGSANIKKKSHSFSFFNIFKWRERFVYLTGGLFLFAIFLGLFLGGIFNILGFASIVFLLAQFTKGLLWLSLTSEIFAIILFILEEIDKSRRLPQKNIREIEAYVENFYREILKKVAFIDNKNLDPAITLDFVKICLEELTEQLKQTESKVNNQLPFIALSFTIIIAIICVAFFNIPTQLFETSYLYGAVSGTAGIAIWLNHGLKLLLGSDSPKLTLCKKCVSSVKAMQLLNNPKNTQHTNHLEKNNQSQ